MTKSKKNKPVKCDFILPFFLLLLLKVNFVTKNAGKTLSLLIEKENFMKNDSFYRIQNNLITLHKIYRNE